VILRTPDTSDDVREALHAFATPESAARGPVQATDGPVLRTYGIGAQILKDLGVRRMRVLSAPKQMHGISAFGLEIEGYVSEEA